MILVLVVFSSILGISYSQVTCDKQTLGVFSNVICVSKTQFQFSADDTVPLDCPPGQVCADVAEICTSTGPALCLNTIAGEDGSCNECLNNKANRVCVSETQYSICNGGEVLTNLTYTCPPPQPYCKATVDGTTGSVTGICVETDVDLDCTGITSPGGGGSGDGSGSGSGDGSGSGSGDGSGDGSGSGSGDGSGSGSGGGEQPVCTADGLFPNTTDTTCTTYYKCTKAESGAYSILQLQCLNAGYAFNPNTKRCEPGYTCTNTA